MLREWDVICFSNNEWRAVPTSKEHIMKLLAKTNNVLYVENIGSRVPKLAKDDIRRIANRLFNALKPLRAENKLEIYSPLILPWHGNSLARRINKNTITRAVKRRFSPNPNRLVWITLPTAENLVGCFDEKLVIYHCIDDYKSFEVLNRSLIEKFENILIKKADLVLVSNIQRYQQIKKQKQSAYYFPHGVNFEHFNHAVKTNPLAKIPSPRVGFAGKIGNSTDLKLIDFLARKNPEISFVLIGPVTDSVDREQYRLFKRRQNVYWIGRVFYDQLPKYLSALTVCLLPFRKTEQIKYSQPQITLEYLSLGKPVVSIPLSANRDCRHLIYEADNYEKFNQALTRALGENRPRLKKQRVTYAKENSWLHRIELLNQIIDNYLKDNKA